VASLGLRLVRDELTDKGKRDDKPPLLPDRQSARTSKLDSLPAGEGERAGEREPLRERLRDMLRDRDLLQIHTSAALPALVIWHYDNSSCCLVVATAFGQSDVGPSEGSRNDPQAKPQVVCFREIQLGPTDCVGKVAKTRTMVDPSSDVCVGVCPLYSLYAVVVVGKK
jgi:hypothetical protein